MKKVLLHSLRTSQVWMTSQEVVTSLGWGPHFNSKVFKRSSYLDLLPLLVLSEVNVGPQLGVGQRLSDQVVLQLRGQHSAVDQEAVDQLMKKI